VSWHARVWFGGADPLGAPRTLDPSGAHESGDLIVAHVMTGTPGGLPHLPGVVDPVDVLPQLPHHRVHDLVALGSC
jgi:hypothetical protein